MLIAVASKTGAEVDQHFGHAERFLIYDYNRGNPKQIAEAEVEKYCTYDPDNPFRHRQFDAIAAALAGCRAVVTAMIGELPKQELKKHGIEPLVASGPIGEALHAAHRILCDCSGTGEGCPR